MPYRVCFTCIMTSFTSVKCSPVVLRNMIGCNKNTSWIFWCKHKNMLISREKAAIIYLILFYCRCLHNTAIYFIAAFILFCFILHVRPALAYVHWCVILCTVSTPGFVTVYWVTFDRFCYTVSLMLDLGTEWNFEFISNCENYFVSDASSSVSCNGISAWLKGKHWERIVCYQYMLRPVESRNTMSLLLSTPVRSS